MSCDSGVHGSPKMTGDFISSYPDILDSAGDDRSGVSPDNPLNFALFGLARQAEVPSWVETNWNRPVLDLGPGKKIVEGAIRCEFPQYNFESPRFLPDAYPVMHHALGEEVDGFTDDLSEYRCCLPFADNSVGGIYAVNIFEHLWDPRPIMEECARVLVPGAPLNIVVPHGLAPIYLQDLDHKKPFVLDTWKNWLDNKYWGEAEVGKRIHLKVGMNFKFAIKEDNVNICTQLIKEIV